MWGRCLGYMCAVRLVVAFDSGLPVARFGALFHVLCLEEPAARLEWRATGFPTRSRPLLDGADVGLFSAPPLATGLSAITLETSRMFVVMAVGHPLARRGELRVADVLDEPFPGGRDLHPEWRAFWTLDAVRGGPPNVVGDGVADAQEGLELVVSGRAIATVAAWMPNGLAHPGVIAVPLVDGPAVATQLVWRADDDSAMVHALVDLARAWTREPDRNGKGA
jgi:DNA-binding transcriptional LysR family regulator